MVYLNSILNCRLYQKEDGLFFYQNILLLMFPEAHSKINIHFLIQFTQGLLCPNINNTFELEQKCLYLIWVVQNNNN